MQLSPVVFERIKPIVDKVSHIHITGLGEPFLNKHIGEYLNYFRDKGKTYYINTNGSLIQETHVNLMLTSACELSISLDAADRQTYQKMRHSDTWEKVIGTIKHISDLRLRQPSRYPLLYLSLHLNRLNLPSLKYLPDLCNDLRIDAVKLSWTILPQTHQHLSPHDELDEASETIRMLAAALRRSGIAIRDEVLFQPHERGCWDLSGLTFIGANAMVAACCNRWLTIGDLTANRFEDIWNGQPHRRIFFGVINRRPEAACQICRQLKIADYRANSGTFLKDARADEALVQEKGRIAQKLPSLENLDNQFASGFNALLNGEIERALEVYAALSRAYPDYYEIRNNLAAAFFFNGQPDKSREMLASLQSLPHNQAIISYNLAYLKSHPAPNSKRA